jgi:arabinose-5-phosphate isomerase
LRHFNSKLIAIVGNLSSVLAKEAEIVLDGSVSCEADPLGFVPTSSTVVAMALGDAMASALMYARQFTEKDFAMFHPAGQLGRNLHLTVADMMHKEKDVPWVQPHTTLREVVISMSEKPLGAACVIDEDDQKFLGIITDGDIRRALRDHEDIRDLCAEHVMTTDPTVVFPNVSLNDAAKLMENRPSQISVLPVLDFNKVKCLGLLRLHDIYQPEMI